MHGLVCQAPVIEKYVSGIRLNEPHDHVEAGGLTGAVRSQQTDDFATRNTQADTFHSEFVTVLLTQRVRFKCCHVPG